MAGFVDSRRPQMMTLNTAMDLCHHTPCFANGNKKTKVSIEHKLRQRSQHVSLTGKNASVSGSHIKNYTL